MNNNIPVQNFIYSPDTVDFVIRQSDYLTDYITQNPDVLFTQTLLGGYVICYANVNAFVNILDNYRPSIISSLPIVLGTLDRQNLSAAGITQTHEQPYYEFQGRGVLIGIIDTGIDYTQSVFRNKDGTSKIQFIYDQSVIGTPPEGFYFGSEYTNTQINEALNSNNPYNIVPEQDTSGHGTFLASIAAGRATDNYTGAAPESELIVVKLKTAQPYYREFYSVPENQENAFESSDVMIGIEYILQKARQLNHPVSICIGLGSNYGSHDGLTIFEEYLNNITNIRGVCLSVAAGNESQASHHMAGFIPVTGGTQNIDLSVGSDAGNIRVSIWNGIADRFSVSVTSPTGQLLRKFPAIPGRLNETDLLFENTHVRVVYYFPTDGNGGQLTVVRLTDAAPGLWVITLYGDIVVDGTFHAWLPITGFVSPNVKFSSTSPYYTITVPGTMPQAICCGAYNSSNNTIYNDSSWGPTLLPSNAPDFVAPGVDVGGFYPGGYGTMSGTSVAAAITAGAGALLLEWGIIEKNDLSLATNQIRAYLIRGCNRSDAIRYPDPKWGYGTLNLLRSFQLMREL